MIHLCCVFDSNNFFIATVFYFINSPFLTILVFVGIWVISKLGVIKWFCEYFSHFFCWIYEHIVLNISLEVYILVKFLVYTDLQCCVCSANVKYWQKDFCTGYKNVYSEQQSIGFIAVTHSHQHLVLLSY